MKVINYPGMLIIVVQFCDKMKRKSPHAIPLSFGLDLSKYVADHEWKFNSSITILSKLIFDFDKSTSNDLRSEVDPIKIS